MLFILALLSILISILALSLNCKSNEIEEKLKELEDRWEGLNKWNKKQ